MNYIYGLLIAMVLAFGLVWLGHSRGYDDGAAAVQKAAQKKVDAANADRDVAIAERDTTALTLANVRRSLSAQKQQLELANVFADAAMTDRNRLQRTLTDITKQRDDALRKAAHESPDCAGLAHLPICPAVAERLWRKAADVPADARH
jgi:hypothetical protein